MSEGTRITRTVDTDLDVDELWAMVADGEAWASWMVDEADVDVAPGVGRHGRRRRRRPARCASTSSTTTAWRSRGGREARPELVSAVELVVLPAVGGSQLRVTEISLSASAAGGHRLGRAA